MPLAPAHPAAVLPLARLGLPLSALVVGAVAPDAPVYLPVGVSYARTHRWQGLPPVVVIALVALWLWSALVRDALVDLTPPLRRRLPAHARLGRRAWLLAPLAVAIGAATHVLWDSATHEWGFIVRDSAFLGETYGPIPAYRGLQHTSTVVGSLVVAAYGVRQLGRRPVVPRAAAVPRPGYWLAAVPVAALVVGIPVRSAEAGVGAALLVLCVVAVIWGVTRRQFA